MARSLYCGKLISLSSLRARELVTTFLLVRFDVVDLTVYLTFKSREHTNHDILPI